MLNKKAIGPVIAITLLIVVSVTSVIYFQGWYNNFQSKLFSDTEIKSEINSVTIEYLEATQVYVKNYNSGNLTFNNLKIGGILCNINGSINGNEIYLINLGNCLTGQSMGPKEVIIYTDKGIYSQTKNLRSILAISGNLSISFTSGICPALYTRVYGLESVSDSHTESYGASNYTYNLCLKHNIYTLGTSCSGIYTRLFYLDDFSNSHAYTSNTTSYFNYTTWQQVCLSSSGSIINSTVNSIDPADGSSCVGSFETIDNVNGAHMGDCSAYSTKIWVKIE